MGKPKKDDSTKAARGDAEKAAKTTPAVTKRQQAPLPDTGTLGLSDYEAVVMGVGDEVAREIFDAFLAACPVGGGLLAGGDDAAATERTLGDLPRPRRFKSCAAAEAWLKERVPELEYVNLSGLEPEMANRTVALLAHMKETLPESIPFPRAVSTDPAALWDNCPWCRDTFTHTPEIRSSGMEVREYLERYWELGGGLASVSYLGPFMLINQKRTMYSWEAFMDSWESSGRFGGNYSDDPEEEFCSLLTHEFGHLMHLRVLGEAYGGAAQQNKMLELTGRLEMVGELLKKTVEGEANLLGHEGDYAYMTKRLEKMLANNRLPFRAYAVLRGGMEMLPDMFACLSYAPERDRGAERLRRILEDAFGERLPFSRD